MFTDVSVKRQITDSISENLTESDLESMEMQNKKSTLYQQQCPKIIKISSQDLLFLVHLNVMKNS